MRSHFTPVPVAKQEGLEGTHANDTVASLLDSSAIGRVYVETGSLGEILKLLSDLRLNKRGEYTVDFSKIRKHN